MTETNTITWLTPAGAESQLQDGSVSKPIELNVVELSLDDPRLISFVDTHPSSTVYHHPAWLRTLSAEYSREVVILACETPNDRLAGIFPLMNTRGVPMSVFGGMGQARLASLPRTPIAGPLGESREVSSLLVTAAIARASKERMVRLQVKTEGPILDGSVKHFFGVPWRKSFVLPLSDDPTRLQIGSSGIRLKHIRSSVKRAESMGVRVRTANSEADLRRWYEIYLRTMRRVIVPPRSLRCFLAMWKYMQPLGLMKVMLAERQSKGKTEMLAGAIFLMHGRRIFYAFSACSAEHFSLQPNDLIQWEAIHWAANNGFREYDLGEVPNEAQHLAAYKAKWGAKERLLYRYYYPQMTSDIPDSSVLHRHQKLLEKIWRRLPLNVTAHLGDLIYSYL